MNKQDFMKLPTCVLRVNIHCEGCKQKVKKLLHKIEGVYSTKIDVEQGKVTVTGDVDPSVLIKKLCKSGKRAELWGGGGGTGQKGFQSLNASFKSNMEIDSGKMGNNNKSKGGKNNNQHPQQAKGGHQMMQLTPHLQQMMKGSKDMKKDQKSVKFELKNHHDEEFEDDDEFDYDDDLGDEFDDDLDDEVEDEEFGLGNGHGSGHHMSNKMTMPMMRDGPNGLNGMMMMNGFAMDGRKSGGGGFDNLVQRKGMGGKIEGKRGNDSKKGSKGGGEKGKKEGKETKGGGGKNGKIGVKSGGGGLLGFLKKGKREEGNEKNGSGKNGNPCGSGGGKNGNFPKKGGFDGAHDLNFKMKNNGSQGFDDFMKQGKGKKGNSNNRGGGGSNGLGPMGQMGEAHTSHLMGNPRVGPMGNYPALQGLAMNGGYYRAPSHPMSQQQYMQMMMMNQQAEMYQPMTYARPYPAVNYSMPPPPMPPPHGDSYAHIFSDENTHGCTIM